MNTIKNIQELNKRELEAGITPEGSWHADYRDTAYIFIGGLPLDLSEGDVITIFSQYGEPVFINLVRDKETGKSKGFGFLKYEDQRSTDLAVDNLGGAQIMGRTLRVDHTRYKRKDNEDLGDNTMGDVVMATPVEESEIEEETPKRPLIKEEKELAELMRNHDDEDPMKAYLIEQKKEEVQEALKKLPVAKSTKSSKDRKHRHHHKDRRRSPDLKREKDRHREPRNEGHGRSSNHHRSRRSPDDHRRRDRSRSPIPVETKKSRRTRHRDSDSPPSERRRRSRSDETRHRR